MDLPDGLTVKERRQENKNNNSGGKGVPIKVTWIRRGGGVVGFTQRHPRQMAKKETSALAGRLTWVELFHVYSEFHNIVKTVDCWLYTRTIPSLLCSYTCDI